MQQPETLIPHYTPQVEEVFTPEYYSGMYALDLEDDLPTEGDGECDKK